MREGHHREQGRGCISDHYPPFALEVDVFDLTNGSVPVQHGILGVRYGEHPWVSGRGHPTGLWRSAGRHV